MKKSDKSTQMIDVSLFVESPTDFKKSYSSFTSFEIIEIREKFFCSIIKKYQIIIPMKKPP